MAKILVVDDDDGVRNLAVRVLQKDGHTVLEASNAKAALALVDTQVGGVDLLFCDLVMAGMSGRELGRHLQEVWPRLKVLYTSGYTTAQAMGGGATGNGGDTGIPFLAKPFTPRQLVERVSEILAS